MTKETNETIKPQSMLTFSGRYVDVTKPRASDIDIIDIALALGNINRFTGHAGPYTVADHSVLVSRLVPQELAAEALLHDAHEAYLGDISTPVKRALGHEIGAYEAAWDAAIRKALLPEPSWVELDDVDLLFKKHNAIKVADRQALWVEKTFILGCADDWGRGAVKPTGASERVAVKYWWDGLVQAGLRSPSSRAKEEGLESCFRFLLRAIDLGIAEAKDVNRVWDRVAITGVNAAVLRQEYLTAPA